MKIKWNVFVGCGGWFEADGYFVINAHLHVDRLDPQGGPVFMVLGEKGKDILITSSMQMCGNFPKKYVRVLKAK